MDMNNQADPISWKTNISVNSKDFNSFETHNLSIRGESNKIKKLTAVNIDNNSLNGNSSSDGHDKLEKMLYKIEHLSNTKKIPSEFPY